jgi:hypothetical protein
MEVNIENVKTLVPLDAWEGVISSVNCVTQTFGQTSDVHITLQYIIPDQPMTLWDDGHLLDKEEHEDRRRPINFFKIKELPHQLQPGET